MSQVELKTKANKQSVVDYLDSIAELNQRNDAIKIDKLMQTITKETPVMWGSSIVGYGHEHLVYDSGRELDWFKIGFSPRKQNLTLYVLKGGQERYNDLLQKLGKHTCGKGCLYIKSLKEIDDNILEELIKRALTI